MVGIRYRLKTKFIFTREELLQGLLTISLFSFVLSFHSWGTTTFNATEGLLNLIKNILLVTIALLIHVSAQKLAALYLGYVATYRAWMNGLLVSVFFALFTFGLPPIPFLAASLTFIPLYFVGTVDIAHDARMRIGRFRYGLNFKDLSRIAFAGVLGNVVCVIVLQTLYLFVRTTLLGDVLLGVITVNLLFAFFSMLPLPSCDGLSILRSSRATYVFLLAFTVVFIGLITISILAPGAGVFALVGAAVIAGLVGYIYNKTIDPLTAAQ